MPTTFNWIYLGTSTTLIDPTEGNLVSENATGLNGTTWGSSGSPLYNNIASATMINNGGAANALDTNNNIANDQFSTTIGGTLQTLTYDANVLYNITLTYADGTTVTTTGVIAQATTGELFLAPPVSAANANFTSEPIVSLTITSVSSSNLNASLASNRLQIGWDNGWVDGTAGNDLINSSYVEPVANGTDVIDGGDGISSSGSSWNDDRVRAGAGNDTVLSGAGNDSVLGETGDDSLDGGTDDDSVYGGTGNDTLLGNTGNDSLSGDDGNDSLYGGTGDDSLYGGADSDSLSGSDGNDVLDGGAGNDTILGGIGNDTLTGGAGADALTGNGGMDYADYSGSSAGVTVDLAAGTGSGGDAQGDTLTGVDGLIGSAYNDSLAGFDGMDTSAGGYTNIFYGGAGDDTLDGRGGDDQLYGGTGNDSIIGGAGADTLTGGAGDDVFVIGSDAADLISDFGTGNSGSIDDGDTQNNDFVDLSQYYNKTTLAAWNLANPTQTYANPRLWMQADQADGVLDSASGLQIQNGGTAVAADQLTTDTTGVVCFARGSRILTERGPVAVELLQPGDRVMTADHGPQPLRWIGSRRIGAAELAAQPNLRPVRIRAGALGADLPKTDLLVSPQHRMLIGSRIVTRVTGAETALVAAKHLTDSPGIAVAEEMAEVEYFHLLFDRHQVIFAEGAATESLYTGPEALKSIPAEARAELFAILPELALVTPPAPARPLLTGRQSRDLAMRHRKNRVSLVA